MPSLLQPAGVQKFRPSTKMLQNCVHHTMIGSLVANVSLNQNIPRAYQYNFEPDVSKPLARDGTTRPSPEIMMPTSLSQSFTSGPKAKCGLERQSPCPVANAITTPLVWRCSVVPPKSSAVDIVARAAAARSKGGALESGGYMYHEYVRKSKRLHSPSG